MNNKLLRTASLVALLIGLQKVAFAYDLEDAMMQQHTDMQALMRQNSMRQQQEDLQESMRQQQEDLQEAMRQQMEQHRFVAPHYTLPLSNLKSIR